MNIVNRLVSCLLLAVLVVAFSQNSRAQATLPSTTLSAAVTTTTSAAVVSVAAATGGSPTITINKNSTFLFVDRELMAVTGVDSTGKILNVTRGYGGTLAQTHASGATVFFGPSTYFVGGVQRTPVGLYAGSCTRGNQIVQPIINVISGEVYDCQGGQWLTGVATTAASKFALGRICTGGVNNAVPLATAGTNTTLAAATSFTYVASIFVPVTKIVTGISILSGGTAGAANHWEVALYPGVGGAALLQSATLASAASTNVFTDYPFTSTYLLAGPARYFVGFQSDGTTDKIQTQAAANNFLDVLTQKPASTTYGTFPSLTPPTTFTDVVGEIACLYN